MDRFLQWIGSYIMCSGIGIGKRNCPKPEMSIKTFWTVWDNIRGVNK